MAQYPIPQFIESEGKIISFLTFRQFFILVGGGAICFLFYYTLPFWLFGILGIGIALLTGTIAFLKIDNTSVVTIALNFISFLTKSKDYVWQKKEHPYPFKIKSARGQETKNRETFSDSESKTNKLGDVKKMVEYRKK